MYLPCLTRDLDGMGGVIKTEPEDFVVDEIPLYPFDGEGDHVLIRIRKRDVSTFDAIRKIARSMRLPEDAFGYAGLKDRRGVTTQWLSLEHGDIPLIQKLKVEGVEVLEVTRHVNKLKAGHLAGNAFRLRVREIDPDRGDCARRILELLTRRGVPNYYDRQRFGILGNSHLVGKALLTDNADLLAACILGETSGVNERFDRAADLYRGGNPAAAAEELPGMFSVEKHYLSVYGRTGSPEKALRSIQGKRRRFFISAYQSYLFNRLLVARIDRVDGFESGDLAFLHRNGRVFLVEDPSAHADRLATFEISPSGPVYGYQGLLAQGAPGAAERALLEAEAVDPSLFNMAGGLKSRGTRRAYRFPITDASLTIEGTDAHLTFTLPKGSYATLVLRELTKNEDPFELMAEPG